MASGFLMKKQRKKLIIEMNVPNLDKDEINIVVNDNVLRVEGKKQLSKESKGKNFYARSESSSQFLEQILLPVNVKGDEAKTQLSNGKLTITVPVKD